MVLAYPSVSQADREAEERSYVFLEKLLFSVVLNEYGVEHWRARE